MLGQYADAEPLYLEAIEIRRQTLGELDPFLAYTLNCLAELYRLMARYAEAESRQLEALEISADAARGGSSGVCREREQPGGPVSGDGAAGGGRNAVPGRRSRFAGRHWVRRIWIWPQSEESGVAG